MSGKRQYLVFDLGASNGRAMVAECDGSTFSMEVVHRFENRPVHAAGTLYWDILRLFSEVKIGLQAAFKKYKDICSLGIDTWGCDFGLLDKNGKLLSNPVNYRDEKRHAYTPKLYTVLPRKKLFQLSAGSMNEIMGIFQLFAFTQDRAVELESGDRFLMMPDLLNYLLTGVPVNEYTDATMALVCNQNTKTWEKELFSRLGIPEHLFRDIIFPGDTIGHVSKQVREELDIPIVPVIAVASHDTASAVTGLPIGRTDKSWAFISLGTWCISGIETEKPIINDEVYNLGYGNNAVAGGRNMLVNYITGLWIIQQCRMKWIHETGRDISWDEVVKESDSSEPGRAFIDVDEPIFGDPKVDTQAEIIRYCGKRGVNILPSVGAIARCIYESLVLKFRHSLLCLEKITGKKIEIIHLVGGGSQNERLCQWTADSMGSVVIAGPTETTSVGNLLMQLYANGEIKSVEEGRVLSLNSSKVKHFQPREKSYWDNLYAKYL
ncbi:MAG: rhamnulokinase, partial [Spirochaetales bacterium]